jgi:hypothetical protein
MRRAAVDVARLRLKAAKWPSASAFAPSTLRELCGTLALGGRARGEVMTTISKVGLVSGDAQPNTGVFFQEVTAAVRRQDGDLLRGLLSASDEDVLRWMVQFVQSATGAAYVFVGELCGKGLDRVRSIAHHGTAGRLDDFEYALADTPCANVLTRDTCVYANGVARLFPKDVLLEQMGIQSYVGVPLASGSGQPLGLLVILDKRPLDNDEVGRMRALLEGFRPRAASILSRRRAPERSTSAGDYAS